MATLRSPGVVVKELDLTNGRAEIGINNIAGFAAPFTKGELGSPVTVSSEAGLIEAFGEPVANNSEYFLSATNYLNYGGTLSVTRVNTAQLKNAVSRIGQSVASVTINNPTTNGKYVSAPSVGFSGGGGTNAAGTAILDADGKVSQVVITNSGSGYSSQPTVTFGAVGVSGQATVAQGSTASASATLANVSAGALTGTLTINDGGSGYSSNPVVSISGGGGSSAGVTVTPTITDGVITAIAVSGGSGYSSAPSISVAAPTGLAITLVSGGTNYDPTATYNVSVTGGAANTGFAATATVSVSGTITGFTVTNFGDYTNFSGVSPVIPIPGTTAVGTAVISADSIKIENNEVYEAQYGDNTTGWLFAAKSAGAWGNGLRVCIVDNGPRQSIALTSGDSAINNVSVGDYVVSGSKKGKVIDYTMVGTTHYVHVVIVDNTSNVYLENPTAGQLFSAADSLTIGSNSGTAASVDDGSIWWTYAKLYSGSNLTWNSVSARPVNTADGEFYAGDAYGRDAVHIAIVDEDGSVTGSKDTIIESFTYLSKASDGRGPQGGLNYYKSILADGSAYIYAGDTIYETNTRTQDFEPVGSKDYDLSAGADYTALASGAWDLSSSDFNTAYDEFREIDSINLEYLIMGPGLATETATKEKLNYIAGIAAERKDCMAFGSPHKGNIIATTGLPLANKDIVKNVKDFYNGVSSSSYLVLDCNYKYVYDRWNQKYCYIPCNTDVAGLVAETAIRQEPWFSPAGFSRGAIRNLAKLAWNPTKTDRDELYANRVNPISTFPGQGAVLFGDKTALSTPSAFDRINVRRLFIVVEKAIEEAAKAQLFELNDEITRNVFKGIIEPFLRNIQSRRGVTDFLVVCDSSNNTSAVIDNNEFVADIYIQPTRSINFITLTFVATRTGISFSEVVAS
tara:strand:- start:2179 stop:4908 length:2730 start_codon:yes stop_codon:yes gene_type:complete